MDVHPFYVMRRVLIPYAHYDTVINEMKEANMIILHTRAEASIPNYHTVRFATELDGCALSDIFAPYNCCGLYALSVTSNIYKPQNKI